MKLFFLSLCILLAVEGHGQVFDSTAIYMKLANSKFGQNDYAGALKLYTQAIRLKPTSATAYEMRGIMNYSLKNYTDASADINRSLQLDSNCGDCHFYLSKINEKLGNTDESKKNRTKLKTDMNFQMAQQYLNSGNDKLKQNDYKSAEENYNKALALFPAYNDAIYQKGCVKIKTGLYKEAIVLFDTLLKHDSTYTDAFLMRGASYLKLLNYDKALPDFSKVIKLRPNDGNAYFNRGSTYYNLKNNDSACTDWQTAYKLGVKEAGVKMGKFCK